ncbi:MAG: hypothetical protein ACI81Y_001810 [Glaciecola sp.]
MNIKQLLKKYCNRNHSHGISKNFILMVFIISTITGFTQDVEMVSKGDVKIDMSSSIASLYELCEAIRENNTDVIMKLTTIEGYEAIVSHRGLFNLQIDVLFWQEAIDNGRVLITEKIESEREFVLLNGRQPYEILCIHSYSADKLMLIEKLTFVYEDDHWKFFLFSEKERG